MVPKYIGDVVGGRVSQFKIIEVLLPQEYRVGYSEDSERRAIVQVGGDGS